MCHTETTQQMPIGAPAPPSAAGGTDVLSTLPRQLPGGGTQAPGPDATDPLSATLSAEKSANPDMVSVKSPTKFGKLLKFALPIMEGAAIGGLTGKSTPGGGFAGANQFYAQRRAMQIQSSMLQRQLQNDQFHNQLLVQQSILDAARTQHEIGRPNFTGRSIVPTAAMTPDGRKVFMRANPDTGEPEEVPGYAPPDKDTPDSFSDTQTDKGLITLNRHTGQHSLATIGDGNAPTSVPGGTVSGTAPTKFNSGSPRTPGSPAQSPTGIATVPLHAPGFGKPKATKVTNRGPNGSESDSLVDENPDSPTFGKPLKTGIASRAPVPDKTNARDDKKTDTNSRVESYAAAAMEKNGNDPEKAIQYLNQLKITDPAAAKDYNAMLPLIRAHIRDRGSVSKTANSKKKARLTPEMAQQLGLQTSSSSVTDEEDDN